MKLQTEKTDDCGANQDTVKQRQQHKGKSSEKITRTDWRYSRKNLKEEPDPAEKSGTRRRSDLSRNPPLYR